MSEEDTLKLRRRAAKGKFTRLEKAVQFLLNENRSKSEVEEAFEEVSHAYQEVSEKHETFTSVITDDDEYDKQEKWMEDCQQAFLNLKIKVGDYCKQNVSRPRSPETESKANKGTDYETGNGIQSETNDVDENDGIVIDEIIGPDLEAQAQGCEPDQEEVVKRSIPHFNMEKPKMPKFGGNVRDYHIFKSDFTHMVGKVYSKRDSITILRSALYGKPLEMVRGIGSDYDAAWEYLDSVYGDPRFTADAIINDINKFKAVKEGEDSRFCELVNLVRTSYKALKEVGRPHDMDNSQMLTLIERKLNMDDRKVWFRYLEREGKQASLSVLIDWLTSEMKSRIRATAALRSEASKSGAAVHVIGKESDAKKFHKCWLCESTNHWTDQCQTFLNFTPAQRWQHVKEHHGCFSCLKKAGRDHRMSNCRRKRACSEVVNGTQCGQFQHPLLHLPAGSVSGIVGVALNTKDQSLLPVVEVDIDGPRGMKQRGNILLDSGAQISLIRTSLAEQLNLKAVGLPCISEELKYMDVDETSKLFGLKPDDVRRGNGSVDILIGIDYAHLHCGDVRQAGHLVARNSPLGWLIFGSSATQEVVASSVLHVKLSSPVDLTDFWTSESMGVNPSSCECKPNRSSKLEADEDKIISDSCEKVGTQWLIPYPWRKDHKLLPDNRSQAERTLRVTEKRLSKNPEYAEAYKREMMEMGHCLNDYWLKGPDLLNNLFGVILRFREHKVATCGDISKMYHRILIPETDQHVYRYLWRDMQIDRPPEVFVKTVLTFGDRPAPAMAQVTLLKTAKEGEQQHPRAAQALRHNAYMDDICLSNPTIEDAVEITHGIDEHLWQKGLDWDSELSERDEEKRRHLFKEMENLNALKFERCLTPVNGRDPILCIFSDASEFAFGTCAYIRWQVSNDSYDVRFLTAKSRVAPLKRLTIPRLELQGTVLAARLSCTILEELTLKPEKVMFMIDSTIVLGWIQSNAKGFKPFVSARVGEIQTVTDPSQWFYVPNEHNVADDVSRGISVEQLKGRWECGPEFLHTPEEEWPLANRPNLLSVEAEGLLKARCQKSQEPKTQEMQALDPSELKEAETFWIKDAQRLLHTRLKCGEFKTLRPFVENDLIRVGGRAKSDLISYDMGHPVLLPQKHHVSKLITQHYHSRGHNGVACTVAKVREKYWILGVHRLAKTVKYRCVTCKVLALKPESQVMASLPKERLAPFTPPFFYTSCDYFGPLQVKVGRNKVTKHYGVIFTCLNTRAVHLGLSVDCSTMEFLQVLRRFFAIGGQPVQILSDNGTQFVGAAKELRLMIQGWSDEHLKVLSKVAKWRYVEPLVNKFSLSWNLTLVYRKLPIL
ncbi:hypothetical protein HOLleu_25277 [Holothuria leucospilota]|uniref:Uncharacterized protein n=1 Tax=Holothuria leucospilota TaxID=206669 RepID=A0A9Q1BSK7_HOLLE|nr:hypothetical protein HOLleu_25277 [Holothuria leucospilota]